MIEDPAVRLRQMGNPIDAAVHNGDQYGIRRIEPVVKAPLGGFQKMRVKIQRRGMKK
jgi:hypothetical protein